MKAYLILMLLSIYLCQFYQVGTHIRFWQSETYHCCSKSINLSNQNICCSPTKGAAGSKLDIITNVKSQMTGWLGSGIPIPGLRKNEAPPAEPTEPIPTEPIEESKPEGKDDDDNSRYIRYEGLADAMSLRSYFFIFFYSHQPFYAQNVVRRFYFRCCCCRISQSRSQINICHYRTNILS